MTKVIYSPIIPGINYKQPMDGISTISTSYQTMAKDACKCVSDKSSIVDVTTSSKDLIIQKNIELTKKIELLNSKIAKLTLKDTELEKLIESLQKIDTEYEKTLADLKKVDKTQNVKILALEKTDASLSSAIADIRKTNQSFNVKIEKIVKDNQSQSSAISKLENNEKELEQQLKNLKTTETQNLTKLQNKDKELAAKLLKLDEKVKTINYIGEKAIEIKDLSSAKQIALKIGPKEKIISQDVSGIYSTLTVNYDKQEKRIKLLGLKGQEISTCELAFVPESVKKIKKDNKAYLQFSYKNGETFLVDIDQFLDIQDDGDGCVIINGKKLGIKVGDNDSLLYVDDVHALRTKNLKELEEFKKLQEQVDKQNNALNQLSNDVSVNASSITNLNNITNDLSTQVSEHENSIQDINLILKGGTIIDTSTGTETEKTSLKEEIIGTQDDKIEIESDGAIKPGSNITLISIKNYVDDVTKDIEETAEFKWNEADEITKNNSQEGE